MTYLIKSSDAKYFDIAKDIAALSDFPKVHVGCVAVYQGHIIGTGCNTNKTHPQQDHFNRYRNRNQDRNNFSLPKAHAEIMCLSSIRNLEIKWSKVKIFVYRIRNDSPFGMARPCPACMAAIRSAGIRNIFYTTDCGYAYEKLLD